MSPAAWSQLSPTRFGTVVILPLCSLSMTKDSNNAVKRDPRFRPRYLHLFDPMLRTSQPQHARMQNRPVLTGIQMPPTTLLVIVDRRGLPGGQGHIHADLPAGELKLHPLHGPRVSQPQDFRIQLLVVHQESLAQTGQIADLKNRPRYGHDGGKSEVFTGTLIREIRA